MLKNHYATKPQITCRLSGGKISALSQLTDNRFATHKSSALNKVCDVREMIGYFQRWSDTLRMTRNIEAGTLNREQLSVPAGNRERRFEKNPGTGRNREVNFQINGMNTFIMTSLAPISLFFPCKEGADESSWRCSCPLWPGMPGSGGNRDLLPAELWSFHLFELQNFGIQKLFEFLRPV